MVVKQPFKQVRRNYGIQSSPTITMPKPDTLVILAPGFAKNEDDTTCIPMQQVFVRALQQARPELKIVVIAFEYPFNRSTYTWNGIQVVAFSGKTGADCSV
jgi:hypothetical protein